MRKKLIMIAIGLAVLIVLAGTAACTGTSNGVTRQQVAVTRGNLTVTVTGSGKIGTPDEARLAFGSGGKVSKIAVTEGDRVKAGDVLAGLDTRSLELAVQQAQMAVTQAEGALAQAQLTQATAQNALDNLKNSGDALQLALVNAQIARDQAQVILNSAITAVDYTALNANLNVARTWYDYVQRQLQQATTDVDSWLIARDRAKESLDAAQAAYDNALAGYDTSQVNLRKKQVEAAELSVTLAQKNIDDLPVNIALQEMQVAAAAQAVKQAQQGVAVAQESLADAQQQLDEATIIAPFDGMVAAVLAKEGDNLPSPSLSPSPVIQLVDPEKLDLVIQVDEIDIPAVKIGQEADVKVDALPDDVFKGQVVSIYPVPVEQGGIVLYQVKMSLDAPASSGIRVGMSASADIMAASHAGVLIVPSRAVTRNSQGQDIVNVQVGSKIEERPVTTGLDDGLKIEIVSGLNEGETVIVEIKAKSQSGGGLMLGG